MPTELTMQRLTIYVGNSHTWRGQTLSLAILEHCQSQGLAGGTVTQGILGFGRHSHIHRPHLLGIGNDLPEKVEIIDIPERIAQVIPSLEEMVQGAMMILEDVQVLHP